MAKVEGSYLVFTSGRRVYVNEGIVGLGPDLQVYEGYDGPLWPQDLDLEGGDTLDSRDLRELGGYMVDRWLQFLDRVEGKG